MGILKKMVEYALLGIGIFTLLCIAVAFLSGVKDGISHDIDVTPAITKTSDISPGLYVVTDTKYYHITNMVIIDNASGIYVADKERDWCRLIESKVIKTPDVAKTPDDPEIKDHIQIYKSGQSEIIKCKRLTVSGDYNSIIIENKDIEFIMVTGIGNAISYSNDASPKIRDVGDYNSIKSSWLI